MMDGKGKRGHRKRCPLWPFYAFWLESRGATWSPNGLVLKGEDGGGLSVPPPVVVQ
jgi:hypothetical protein